MVREHHHRGLVVHVLHHLSQHLIDLLIELWQCGPIFRRERGIIFRMFRVDQAPQHVRIQIKAGEIEKEQAGMKLGKLGIENLAMFCQDGVRLLQIFLVVENSGRAGLRVF